MIRQNRLLAALAADDRDFLSALMEGVDLPRGLELSLPRTIAEYCYFPGAGIISTVVVSPEGNQTEIGVIGREGMSPSSVILGSDQNPFRTVIQVDGHGWRIRREALARFIEERPPVRRIMLHWAQAFSSQIAYTALSHSVHTVDERLARWILMCHDRVDGDRLALTHEFLSIMLAVRRPSVTNALHILEGNGFIHSLRGTIIIRDRAALEAFAADSYGGSEREYARLFSAPAA
ncbi:Crp/Fnr family transcriptional regulator [Shinella pollutisoli]|uniref:Crp/Fnr family transcriptional regulator n=1 Tax=Shinella pollutisoli TaxID=2250594 RepID=A0ABV7DEA9_9HYPH|nr:Crp/Fnr family transcriptional regulator [Shinella pollutisoli]